MPPKLRRYQHDLKVEVANAFAAGAVDVLVVSPTGSGKTVYFCDEIRDHPGASVAIAHRQELVSQISIAMARNEVRHRIIGATGVTKNIIAMHIAESGRSYYDANARHAAAGVDTLIRMPENDPFFKQVTQIVMDESHHVLRVNKWGRARQMFTAARAIHVTATPIRADGCGLGRHADGFIDTMVMAPTMRTLIDAGYLTDYRVISVQPQDLDLSGVHTTASGEFNMEELRDAVHRSQRLVGDVVKHYLEWAPGKLGVTFAVDVSDAAAIAKAFRAAGVPAEVITAKTPAHLRMEILRRFRRREVLQLVNVDLFGEGFDLPAIEVVSFARPTQSWALFCQQFGRVLRLMLDSKLIPTWDDLTDVQRREHIATSDKPYGMVIDHVGNIIRHMGPPDKRMEFTLNRREKRSSNKINDAIPYRNCLNPSCMRPYERVFKACPYCNYYPEPAARSGPEFVDGSLFELSPETLAAMRGDIARIDGPALIPFGVDNIVRLSINKRHVERQQAQAALRIAMSWWAGLQDTLGRPDLDEKFRRFYFMFGVDTGTAQSFGAPDAEKLRIKICDYLARYGIDGTVNNA